MKLLLILLLVCSTSFGQVAEPARPMIQFPDGTFLSKDNPMPVDASISIDEITVDVFPVYADEDGNPHTAEVDTDSRVKINIASDTIGLVEAIGDLSVTATSIGEATKMAPRSPIATEIIKVQLAANVPYTFINPFYGMAALSQKYVEIKTTAPDSEFWINFGSAPSINGNSRPCTGRIYIETQENVHIIASTSLDVYITSAAVVVEP